MKDLIRNNKHKLPRNQKIPNTIFNMTFIVINQNQQTKNQQEAKTETKKMQPSLHIENSQTNIYTNTLKKKKHKFPTNRKFPIFNYPNKKSQALHDEDARDNSLDQQASFGLGGLDRREERPSWIREAEMGQTEEKA